MRKFDFHLSTGAVHTVGLIDSFAQQSWFLNGLKPSGWICMDGLQNYNMAHVVAIVPHAESNTEESA